MNIKGFKFKPTDNRHDLEEVTRKAIQRDAEQAEREALNCEQCQGLDTCRNSMPGYCAVIRQYPDRTKQPYLALRKCEKNGGTP